MYSGFQQIAVSSSVLDVDDLTIPAGAVAAELQASENHVRYTMDNSTAPSVSSGMLFLSSSDPKIFGIDSIKRMKFIRDGSTDSKLNIHYMNGPVF